MVWLVVQALPIDTSREDIKESLKKSQLGSRIMFLAKCPDETPGNKKTAVELVQNWSRPIFFDPEAEAEKRRQREEALKKVMGKEWVGTGVPQLHGNSRSLRIETQCMETTMLLVCIRHEAVQGDSCCASNKGLPDVSWLTMQMVSLCFAAYC
jgi:hypothetical protein